MATVKFWMKDGSVPMYSDPTLTTGQLKEKIEKSLNGPNPNLALVPGKHGVGSPIVLPKSEINRVSYES